MNNMRSINNERSIKYEGNVIKYEHECINALLGKDRVLYNPELVGNIDMYTTIMGEEFKKDKDCRIYKNLAEVVAQQLYYLHDITIGVGKYVTKPLPPFYKGCSCKTGFVIECEKFEKFFTLDDEVIDWGRKACNPDPVLVDMLMCSNELHDIVIHSFDDFNSTVAYFDKILTIIREKGNCALKKLPTPSNVIHLYYSIWRKPFVAQKKKLMIQYNISEDNWDAFIRECYLKDLVNGNSELNDDILTIYISNDVTVEISINPNTYAKIWQNMRKIDCMENEERVMLYVDCLLEMDTRCKGGDYYTREDFVNRSNKFIPHCANGVLKSNANNLWNYDWSSGKYRYLGIGVGRGTLEWDMPKEAEKYSYLCTLREEDVEFCKKRFKEANVWKYDYLVDDVVVYKKGMKIEEMFDYKTAPKSFVEDLEKFKRGEIIFIIGTNPPYFAPTGERAGNKTNNINENRDLKANVSNIIDWMKYEGVSDIHQQMYVQFMYRIKKEFEGGKAILALYSPIGFLSAVAHENFRKKTWKATYLGGYIFSSATFRGTSSSDWGVLFSVWDLNGENNVPSYGILYADEINNECHETDNVIEIRIDGKDKRLQYFIVPEKTSDKTIEYPTGCSGFVQGLGKKHETRKITDDFICDICFEGGYSAMRRTNMLSIPHVSARNRCVVPANFENSCVACATSTMPTITKNNKHKHLLMPSRPLTSEFTSDCVIYTLFSNKNECVAYTNLSVGDKTWDVINNNMFPFLQDDVKNWCAYSNHDYIEQIEDESKERFVANWIEEHKETFSEDSYELLNAAKKLYEIVYRHIGYGDISLPHLNRWDIGFKHVHTVLLSNEITYDEIRYEYKTEIETFVKLQEKMKSKLFKQMISYGMIIED